jgi:phage-related protein
MADLATLATLLVKIKADTSELSEGLSKVQNSLNKFSNIALGIGGTITGALAGIVYKTTEVGDKFNDMSKRTGESVENLSALAYVAELSGTSIDSLERGMKNLAISLGKIAEGSKAGEDLQKKFEALGVSVLDADGKLRSTTDVVLQLADVFKNMENETERTALAAELFGARVGPELIPMLLEGREGLEGYMQKARELGITMSQEDAQAADAFNDALTTLKGALAGLAREVGTTLIPALIPLIEKFTEIVKRVGEWIDKHPVLFEWLVKIAGAGGPLLLMAGGVGKLVGAISPLLGLLSGGGGLIGSLGSLTGVFSSLLPFLGPAGLIAGGVLAVYLAWQNWDKIKEFCGRAWEAVKSFGNSVKETLSGLASKAKEWASNFWENYKKTSEERSKVLANFFTKTVPETFRKFPELVKEGLQWGRQFNEAYYQGLAQGWKVITEWAKSAVEWFRNVFAGLGEWFVNFFKGLAEKVAGFFSNLWNTIKSNISKAGQALKNVVTGGGNVPAYQRGGVVEQTGLALVHKGETVLPRGVQPVQISFGNIVVQGSESPLEAKLRARELADMIVLELQRRGISLA